MRFIDRAAYPSRRFVPPSAATGTPCFARVNEDGWTADIFIFGFPAVNLTSAYSLTPDATPKVTFTVTSPGFDSSGAATTITRTIYGTVHKRRRTPLDTLPTEWAAQGGVFVTIALSDYIYARDKITSVAFLSGFYTANSVASAAVTITTLSIKNASILDYPKPIACWITENNLVVSSGANFTVEMTCVHAYAQSAREVAAVVFIASDGTHTVTSSAVASMTQSARITGGNPVPCYSYTFNSGTLSSLNDGAITIDFVAYPFVGDKPLQASLGADGVAIAATTLTSNLHALAATYDSDASHTPIYAWVQPTGTASGTSAIQTSASDPGTGNSSNYPTIVAAITGIKSYNNSNRSHNDTAGGVIYLRASGSPYSGFGGSITGQTAGSSWVTVSAAPGETPSTVVVQTGSSKTCTNRMKFVNVAITPSDGTSGNGTVLNGGDGANTNPITTEVLFDGCKLTVLAAATSLVNVIGLRQYYNCTIDQSAADGCVLKAFSTNRMTIGLCAGSTITGSASWLTNMLGNAASGNGMVEVSAASANYIAPTSSVMLANKWMAATTPFLFSSPALGCDNIAIVQNVFEKTTADSGTCFRLGADNTTTPLLNAIRRYNTIVGERTNFLYNDNGSVPIFRVGVQRFNIDHAYNVKRDTFTTTNRERIGNWSHSHGVGALGNVAHSSTSGSAASSTSWYGEYFGLAGKIEQTILFTLDASAVGTNLGNGNYTLAAISPAHGVVPSGFAALPFDLAGTTRANDGSGAAGAYEGGA